MAKVGRPEVMDELPDALHRSIDEWILSHARHSASRIFRKFNLVERDIKPDTFRRYVARVRDRAPETTDADPIDRDYDDADDLMIELLIERAEAGDAKHFVGISAALRALAGRRRLKLDELAAQRAEEKHEAWKDTERKRLAQEKAAADARLDALAQENGIPDQVVESVKALYGISL